MIFVTEQAEALALQALAWLIGQDELRDQFLGLSGLSVDDLRQNAQNPEVLGGLLDFLLQDDTRIQDFCDACNHPPEAPFLARQALPGGEIHHWT